MECLNRDFYKMLRGTGLKRIATDFLSYPAATKLGAL